MSREMIPWPHVPPILVPNQTRTLSLHDHVLSAYLPYFTTHHFRHEPDVDLILDTWLSSSPGLLSPSPHYSTPRERDLRGAFYMVIDAIEDAHDSGESGTGASRRLFMELEDQWEDDMRFGTGRAGSRTQRLFRALAEVSDAARSRAIASVLWNFFLGMVHEIAEEEDTPALVGWCWGVARSAMDGREKERCLRALIMLRPDVLEDMDGSGDEWMPLQAMKGAAMNLPRRRRAAGRRHWDEQNDRRMRQLIEEQDYIDRAADRDRRLELQMRNDPRYYRMARRRRPARLSKSVDSVLRRSRSPRRRRRRYDDDYDDDDEYDNTFMPGLLDDTGMHARAEQLRRQARKAMAGKPKG